ncbi:MAG: hypothetical protein JJ866_21510 [Roseibium sp.]|uniref:hypothetical protein n=1 Tax=Roseibium sp. TaxID=1936156 RepID=UPI001B0124D7|nr:hypothetical protein [Roseibium sp.]MBO6894534.1 hypothetical protein [Roseibium sp.]MBO6929472.1 hypothetical protein [Roseibium sp.]
MQIYLSDTVKNNVRRATADQYSRPNSFQKTRSGLEIHYKPVGIAALSAAALCMHATGKAGKRADR